MEQEENKIVLPKNSEKSLSSQINSIIEKGLIISNDIEISHSHIFSEDELSLFRKKFNELREKYDEIPQEFTNCITSNPHKVKSAFNPNQYFHVFDKLFIESGSVLDYVYHYDCAGGRPFMYARMRDESPINSYEEYFERFSNIEQDSYLNRINFDKSFLGFFQYGLFHQVHDCFYRYWHCYDARTFILTRGGLERYIEDQHTYLNDEKIQKILSLDQRPKILLNGPKGELKLTYFDQIGGGLYVLTTIIEWPNKFVAEMSEEIMKNRSYLF